MLRSKATAALMRLKEMDRKYNIKHKFEKRAVGNVSTESSLENTPRSPQPKANNNKLELVQTFTSAAGENEVASKVLPEPKTKVQTHSPRVEDAYLKKSSKTPEIRTETSVEIETNEESASITEESLRTASNLESASENDSMVASEVKDDASEDSRRHSEDSSVTTVFSRRSGDPEIISEAIKSENGPSSSVKASNPDERSEIISELSNAVSKDHPARENLSNVSSVDEQKLQYENTFEEASDSTVSLNSIEAEKSTEEVAADTVIFGVKQIKITPHKAEETIEEEEIIHEENVSRDKEIIELIGPKAIRSNSECDVGLDEELSNYVKTTENEDVVVPINLLKLSKQGMPMRKCVRKTKKHRRSSNENTDAKTDTSAVSEDREKLTEPKANQNEGEPPKENISSATIGEAPVVSAEEEKEAVKAQETEKEPETVSSEQLLTEIPKKTDVTSTLRELNKDAINAIVRRHKIRTMIKSADKPRRCRNCKTVMKFSSQDTPEKNEDDDSKASLENDITDLCHHHKSRGRRTKTKKSSKASKARRAAHQEKAEDFGLTRHLRKQATALRMQQEREDIRNYLLELERTRLEFGPGDQILSPKIAAFKPLDFPKILAFKKPNLEDSNLDSTNVVALQEKIQMIKQWLKDQYLLYRDYSKLAQTMNAKYIPATLEDAKKTIRQLQAATIESR